MGLLDQGCTCDHCLNLTKQKLQAARDKWKEGKREIVFKHWHSSCGDGCCDNYGTNVYVNGFDLSCNGEDEEQIIASLMEFLNIDNVSVESVYED